MTETETPNVQQAWAAVMGEVRELGKDQLHNSPGARFNFRGVDDVMNAVGPVLRKHRVSVVPTGVQLTTRATQTSTGKATQEATVVVTYLIQGPAGDSMAGGSAGGAMDSGDKGVPKAMSVAFRTFLLQSLCLPTHDTDPDAEAYERVAEPTEQELAQQVYTGLLDSTTEAEAREWGNRAHARGLLDLEVHGTALRAYVTERIGALAAPAPEGVPA